jgi:acyl carrier protein
MEETFDIPIDDIKFEKCKNVGDLVRLVEDTLLGNV